MAASIRAVPRRIAVLASFIAVSGFASDAPPSAAPVPDAYVAELAGSPAAWSPQWADLGKRLFADPLLSGDRSVACSTCHVPEKAFTDGRPLGVGVREQVGKRNTPTIVNRSLGRSQFWDGRAETLEGQALLPIENPLEMDLPVAEAIQRLREDRDYVEAFERAFGGEPTAERLAAALAAYERTVWSVDAPFDRFIAGDGGALSESAQRGLMLFGTKARCGECHVGLNFTDELYHVLGLSDDPGRGAVTGVASERGAFKTPSLRDVALTAPYMHDGSLGSLLEVVDYYDKGGTPHVNLSPKITKLGLDDQEKADLVAFMESLTGRTVELGLPQEVE